MRKSQASKRSVDKLRKVVAKIASAGDLPLDLLMEGAPSAPAVPEASHIAAGQSEEPVATAHTAEEMIQMLSNPVVPQPGDDEIQLEETEGAEDAMQTETT